MLHIETTGKADLIRELSLESVQYFAGLELNPGDWAKHETPLDGKFVRFGEVIVLGATMDYGPLLTYVNRRKSLNHIDICQHVFRGMGEEIVERIKSTTPNDASCLKGTDYLLDAGYTSIKTWGGKPYVIVINDESVDFGRGDESARQKTWELAEAALAPYITVFRPEV